MLGIFSDVMKVATRSNEIAHSEELHHGHRKRNEPRRWNAYRNWFDRGL